MNWVATRSAALCVARGVVGRLQLLHQVNQLPEVGAQQVVLVGVARPELVRHLLENSFDRRAVGLGYFPHRVGAGLKNRQLRQHYPGPGGQQKGIVEEAAIAPEILGER